VERVRHPGDKCIELIFIGGEEEEEEEELNNLMGGVVLH
jgi:hypothetical protein